MLVVDSDVDDGEFALLPGGEGVLSILFSVLLEGVGEGGGVLLLIDGEDGSSGIVGEDDDDGVTLFESSMLLVLVLVLPRPMLEDGVFPVCEDEDGVALFNLPVFAPAPLLEDGMFPFL